MGERMRLVLAVRGPEATRSTRHEIDVLEPPRADQAWDRLDVALREGRLVTITGRPAAGGPLLHASRIVPGLGTYLALRPLDDRGWSGLPRLRVAALRKGASGSERAEPVIARWGHEHGVASEAGGWIWSVDAQGRHTSSRPFVQGWWNYARRVMPEGSLLLVDGRHHLAESLA